MMKQNEIKKFLNDNVYLDPNRYQQVKKTYSNIKENIEKEMKGFVVTRQGSIRTKTAIQPINPDDEYDLDVAVVKNIFNDNFNFIKPKNRLENLLKNKYKNVTRKSKCINIVWTRQFNGDFIIMRNFQNDQWIYDEKLNTKIHSNNISLADQINKTFARTTNDAYRDANVLAKYYLRQHKATSGILPSITLSTLVMINVANHSWGYLETLETTLSNLAHIINNKIKNNDLITEIPNPVGGNALPTNWKSIFDMKNFVLVVSQIVQDIKSEEGLKRIDFNSSIRLKYVPSSTSEKPWTKNK